MAFKDDLVKILWVSDIHYRVYEEVVRVPIEAYLDKFAKKVGDEGPYDYIIFSGDIAFDGMPESYTAFKKDILERLERVCWKGKTPKVLVIPGNHDVCWEQSAFIGDFLKGYLKDAEEKNTFLKSNVGNFNALFENYTNAFATEPVLKLPDTKIGGHANTYLDKRLFGFHIDKEKKLLFVLLNSSWFSLGTRFDDLLIEHFEATTYWKDDIIKIIVAEKNKIQEYGGQVVGQNLLSPLNLPGLLKEYEDYVCITVMHHPLHWLHWSEIYSEDPSFVQLRQILERTDIFLTGHEHVPVNVDIQRMFAKTHHFRAGKFLDDNVEKVKKVTDNRFSIFTIEKTFSTPMLTEQRFVYSNMHRWDEAQYPSEKKIPLQNKMDVLLSWARINGLAGKVLTEFNFEKYILDQILHGDAQNVAQYTLQLPVERHLHEPAGSPTNNSYKRIECTKNGVLYSFVLCDNPGELFNAILQNHSLLLTKSGACPSIFTFVAADVSLLPEDIKPPGEDSAPYLEGISKSAVVTLVVEDSDIAFDGFKTDFFNSFEENAGGLGLYKNVAFCNCIVPFLQLERYI